MKLLILISFSRTNFKGIQKNFNGAYNRWLSETFDQTELLKNFDQTIVTI